MAPAAARSSTATRASTPCLTLATSGSSTFGGQILSGGTNGAISLVMSGTGTQVLAGANTYTGATTVSAGALGLTGTLGGGSGGGTAISVGPGGMLTEGATGVISGSSSLAFNSAKTSVLSGSNTYTGTTTLSTGTLQLGTGAAGQDGSIAGASIVDNANLTYNLAGAQTYAGAISGTGSLTKNGPGVLALASSNGYSGGTNLSAGTLNFGNAAALGGGTAAFAGSATLQAGVSGTVANALAINPGVMGTLDTQAYNVTFSGLISGGGSLTKLARAG